MIDKKQKKEKRTFNHVCAKFTEEIKNVFSLDISSDAVGTHPPFMCRLCYKQITSRRQNRNRSSSVSDSEKSRVQSINQQWCLWSESTHSSDCFPCVTYIGQRTGAVPRKKKLPLENELPGTLDVSSTSDTLTFVDQPQCHSTPIKRPKLVDAQTSPFVFHKKSDAQTSPNVKGQDAISITECREKSLTLPLNKEEEKLTTSLVKRKLNTSSDKSIVRCQTGGQPVILKRLSKP